MITGLVGKLIKAPTVNERINIPGKTVVDLTIVENRKRGEKKVANFYNLTMICGTENQSKLVLGFTKGTVLSFYGVRVNYVKGGDRDAEEITNNINADVQGFEIISGGDDAGEGGGGGSSAPARAPQAQRGNQRQAPARQARGGASGDNFEDPFGGDDESPFG